MSADQGEGPGVQSFVHTGVVVDDLDEVVRFLTLLGFECGRRQSYEGEWIERIMDVENVRIEILMARAADGSGELELLKFHSPVDEPAAFAPANRPGIRHLAYRVGDLRETTDRLRDAGWPILGEIVNNEDQHRLCYVRGPEGLILELAERFALS